MNTIEQTAKPTACPICDKRLSLAYIRASDGREWVFQSYALQGEVEALNSAV